MSHQSLSSQLKNILQADEPLTFGILLNRIGEKGFGIFLLILSLPSALPIPAPGYSIPFGILLLIIGAQMTMLKPAPILPSRFAKLTIQAGLAEKMVQYTAWFFGKIEWFLRPRMRWIGNRGGRLLMGVLVMVMAALMIIPIPLTNTLPAMVIFLIGIGLSEEDGIFALLACAIGVCAVLLYGGLVYALIVHGPEVIETIKTWIYSLFSSSAH